MIIQKSIVFHSCSIALLVVLFLGTASALSAQTYLGPDQPYIVTTPNFNPAVTSTIDVNSGRTIVVGNTTVSVGGGSLAARVTGGSLLLDSQAGPKPGPITVNTVSGTALNASGGSIQVNGASIYSGRHGAIAENGGTITLGTGSSITTTSASNAIALGADNGGRVTATSSVPIITLGAGATGVYARNKGTVSLLSDSVLQVLGPRSVGLMVDNANISRNEIGTGLTIHLGGSDMTAASSTGVAVTNGGSVSLENLKVLGQGVGAGVWVAPGSSAVLYGSSDIQVAPVSLGPNYYTATYTEQSQVPFHTFSTTAFSQGAGLLTQGGTISSVGTAVQVITVSGIGYGAYGANANQGGVINLQNSTITTNGSSTVGLAATNAYITAQNSRVSTTWIGGGTSTPAAMSVQNAGGPGVIELTNTSVQASGPNAYGLLSFNFDGAEPNRVNMFNSSLISGGATVGAMGRLDLVLSNASSLTAGSEQLLAAYDNTNSDIPTWVRIAAYGGSTLVGDAEIQPGAKAARADISLNDGSRWAGAALPVSNVIVDPSSIWMVTAVSTLSQQLTNSGRVEFTAPQTGSFKLLKVLNYLGQGGTFDLNVYLGENGAGDRLVIDGGRASGGTLLNIRNVGGLGAPTKGDGILLVEVINGGYVDPGSFALAHPGGIVTAGSYEYELYQATNSNLYLRSRPMAPKGTPIPMLNMRAIESRASPMRHRPPPIPAQMP
ncbi:MAG: hypothetical protein LBS40_01385 [Burkholderiales bacterium]|jgi:hypothetical protein|nr:hypothetical protein [Burkholderiales bacterium]